MKSKALVGNYSLQGEEEATYSKNCRQKTKGHGGLLLPQLKGFLLALVRTNKYAFVSAPVQTFHMIYRKMMSQTFAQLYRKNMSRPLCYPIQSTLPYSSLYSTYFFHFLRKKQPQTI